MNRSKIYLDNNATTFLDPSVVSVMVDHLQRQIGNPSSVHSYGQEARNLITKARRQIASYLGTKPHEIIFTSGGTEALNMCIKGFFGNNTQGHVITSSVEHSAVYQTTKYLESQGSDVSFLSPGLLGCITPEAVKAAIRPSTRLIILMAVNNETGVKTDIEAIAEIALEHHIPFIVDGVALLGKEVFNIPKGVSALCFSAHKLHGPTGIGLAFIRNHLKLQPLISGGPQEYGRRGGTENIPAILGFSQAISLLKTELPMASKKMAMLRDHLENSLLSNLSDVIVNGKGQRVVNTSNLSFLGIEGESLLMKLDLYGIAVSHGSACSSGALEPSRVLLNMGIDPKIASTSVRFSLSRFTTREEIDLCIEAVINAVTTLRKLNNYK
jgi:cysteine desulfurase